MHLRAGDSPPSMSRVARIPGTAWALAAYLGLVVLASWPLILDLDGSLFFHEKRFDGYGTVWFGEHSWRSLKGETPWLSTTAVAWPDGLDLRQADSFLYGLLYAPFRLFLSPVASFNAFSLLAIAATGAAGYWMAAVPLRSPGLAAFGCGAIMAFNSLMHTYRIEGEAYLLAGLFVPLLAGHLVLAARTGRPEAGLKAAVALGALAWSSGYYAVDGALVALVLGLSLLALEPGEPVERRRWPAVATFSLGSLALIVPLAVVVLGALSEAVGARAGDEDPLVNVAMDAVSLSGILVPYPETAFLRQGRIHYLGAVGISLALVAVTVRRPRETLPWVLVALTGTVLSLGPSLRLDDLDPGGASLPYAWLYELVPGILAYRMPARFMALTYLGLGALSALLLARLAEEGLGRGARTALVGLLLLDGLVFTGFSVDTTEAPAQVPSGYDSLSGEGAVLDLWGRDREMLKYAGLSAFYQAHHGQPSMTDFTRGGSPQEVLGRRLAVAVIEDREEDVREILEVLGHLGVTDIALHSASFHEADGSRLRQGLKRYCRAGQVEELEVEESDPVEVFYVAEPRSGSPAAARATLDVWLEQDA